MSYKTIFDKDEHTTTTYEEGEGKVTLVKHQDASPIVERNKNELSSGVNNLSDGPVGRKVASIPLTVWQNWIKATNGEIQRDPKLLAKYLNDPDNALFRTHNSTV